MPHQKDKKESVLLYAKNINKSFNYPSHFSVLKDLSLTIFRKQAIAIMGASGEGKTTLLHILGSLSRADSGDIFIEEKAFTSFPIHIIRQKFMGFIFQSHNLLDDFSTLENIIMPARIARYSINKNSDIYKKAISLLDYVGLKKRMFFPAKHLSGGEKQRVAIARSLILNPKIILADEPSGNLDYKTSKTIHHLLLECVRTMGKTIIIVTHDKELASLCDKIYLLKNGKLFLQN